MITLRYSSPYFVAGLWLGELPNAIFTPEAMVERVISAPSVGNRSQAQAAVEMSIIYGPRAEYGLLGATLTPGGSNRLRVRVATTEREGPRFAGPSVRKSSWTGQVGLPREYAGAVIEGAIRTLETDPLGGGELRFECAAHHLVDSNQRAFAALAAMVARLLQPDAASMTEEQLAALAKMYLRPSRAIRSPDVS